MTLAGGLVVATFAAVLLAFGPAIAAGFIVAVAASYLVVAP